MVEQTPEERRVVSSILTRGTTKISHGRLAQLVRALRLHRRCQRFESSIAHQVALLPILISNIKVRGYGSMVEFLLAKEGIGVRFPLAAPTKDSDLFGIFCWNDNRGIERVEVS